MIIIPDFRKANFAVSLENPYCLTPPGAQAVVGHSGDSQGKPSCAAQDPTPRISDAESSEHSNETNVDQNYPDPSFSTIIDAFHEAITQRKAQGLAFLELTNSELMLIKKSFFVTVFAGLAAFAVGTVCWLIVNIALGSVMHVFGLHYVAISFLLLAINAITAVLLFKLAQNAFGYLGFQRLISMWKRIF